MNPIAESKHWRKELDDILQLIKVSERKTRERSLSITKLQEAIMWLGMDLKSMREEGMPGVEDPYPGSYDPENPKIEPTAEGLKL